LRCGVLEKVKGADSFLVAASLAKRVLSEQTERMLDTKLRSPRLSIVILLGSMTLGLSGSAPALPAPPPSQQKLSSLKAFFDALPKSVPAANLEALRSLVSPTVQVHRNGQLAHASRESWFKELAQFNGPGSATRATISRERFFETPNQAIVVLEFSVLLPAPEDVGQIQIHTAYPFQFVTYAFEEGKLARVDYGPRLESFPWLEPKGPPWPAPYSGWPSSQ
jgi:hypothetical protein